MNGKRRIEIKVGETTFYLNGKRDCLFIEQSLAVEHPSYPYIEVNIETLGLTELIISVNQFRSVMLKLISFLNATPENELPFSVEKDLRAIVNQPKYKDIIKTTLSNYYIMLKLNFEDLNNFSIYDKRIFFTIPNRLGYKVKVKIVFSSPYRYKTFFTVNNNEGKVINIVRWKKYKNAQSFIMQVTKWASSTDEIENVEILKEIKSDIKRYVLNNRHRFSTLFSILNDYTRKENEQTLSKIQ